MGERHFWEDHHARRRMIYPAEEVVRLLAYAFPDEKSRRGRRALDVGAGSGRHTVLLGRWGFRAYAVDYALRAVLNVRTFLAEEGLEGRVACGAMDRLPFRDSVFDVVLPWESIFYGDEAAVARAVAEVRRVLAPGGLCFANLRSPGDSHVAESEALGPNVYLNRGEWDGLTFTVYDEEAARRLFAEGFELVWFDRYVVTRRNETARDAGWMLLVRKK
ncbi:MAG: methyltransferase domain-containing protein [candidate division Zixibacteria bacterium]|nr:methyltransferase domain-containing protein [candidate division Zixibacteria bacterium]